MLQSTAVAYFLLRLFSFSGLLLLCCPSLFLTHSFTQLCRVLLRKFVLNWTTNLRLRNCKHLACRRLQLLGLSEQAGTFSQLIPLLRRLLRWRFLCVCLRLRMDSHRVYRNNIIIITWSAALRSQNPESIELPMLVFCFLETGSLLLAIHQART